MIEDEPPQSPSSDGDSGKPAPTLFGFDIYLIAFVAIGGGFIMVGIYWIFFSGLPMPIYCGSGRNSGSSICGWIDRSGRQTSAPWADRPSSPRTLDRPAPPS